MPHSTADTDHPDRGPCAVDRIGALLDDDSATAGSALAVGVSPDWLDGCIRSLESVTVGQDTRPTNHEPRNTDLLPHQRALAPTVGFVPRAASVTGSSPFEKGGSS